DRTMGPGHDQFWDWCAKAELRLQRCTGCHGFAWPVVDACEHCGGTAFEWTRMTGTGRLVSWCSFERDYYSGLLPIPWDTILVELDEGPLFISNPHGFGWRDCQAGMAVRVVFVDAEDGAGRFVLPEFERD
ncbi:MAG: hypothetical protein RL367_1251, partial [Pseudomonadota bacterium]